MTSVTSDDFDQHLELAMRTRPVIEQAKGVLAGFRCATPEQAFTELVRVSQTYNVKLNMLAETGDCGKRTSRSRPRARRDHRPGVGWPVAAVLTASRLRTPRD